MNACGGCQYFVYKHTGNGKVIYGMCTFGLRLWGTQVSALTEKCYGWTAKLADSKEIL